MMSTNFRKQQLEHAMTHDLRNQVMRGKTHPHAQAQFAKGGEEMAALRPAVDKKPRGMERVAFHEVYGVAAKAAPAARPAAGYGVSAKGGGFVVSFEEEFGGGARKEAGGRAGGCGCDGACGGEKGSPSAPWTGFKQPASNVWRGTSGPQRPGASVPRAQMSAVGNNQGAAQASGRFVNRGADANVAHMERVATVASWVPQVILALYENCYLPTKPALANKASNKLAVVAGVCWLFNCKLTFKDCDDAAAFLSYFAQHKKKYLSGYSSTFSTWMANCRLVACGPDSAVITCTPCQPGWVPSVLEYAPGVLIHGECTMTAAQSAAKAAADALVAAKNAEATQAAKWLQSKHGGYVIVVTKKGPGSGGVITHSFVLVRPDPATGGVVIDGEALQACDDGQLPTFVPAPDAPGVFFQSCEVSKESCPGPNGAGCPTGTVCARCGGNAFAECTPLSAPCGAMPVVDWVDAGYGAGSPAGDVAGDPAPQGSLAGFVFADQTDASDFTYDAGAQGQYDIVSIGDGWELVDKNAAPESTTTQPSGTPASCNGVQFDPQFKCFATNKPMECKDGAWKCVY